MVSLLGIVLVGELCSRENLSGEMDGPDDKSGQRTDECAECGQTPLTMTKRDLIGPSNAPQTLLFRSNLFGRATHHTLFIDWHRWTCGVPSFSLCVWSNHHCPRPFPCFTVSV